MKYENFTCNIYSGTVITHSRQKYERTDSGKNWRANPSEIKRETVSREFYENFVRSIPFFNGFAGGSCRAEREYTIYGYIPVKITTISPDRQTKYIDKFYFKETED